MAVVEIFVVFFAWVAHVFLHPPGEMDRGRAEKERLPKDQELEAMEAALQQDIMAGIEDGSQACRTHLSPVGR